MTTPTGEALDLPDLRGLGPGEKINAIALIAAASTHGELDENPATARAITLATARQYADFIRQNH